MAIACAAASSATVAAATRGHPVHRQKDSHGGAGVPRLFLRQRNASSSKPRSRAVVRTRAATKETFASFDDLIAASSVPVLVDFYATWCGPCQLLSTQVLPQLAASVGPDKVKLVKINTEKYPNIASKYKIEALPTIMLFKNGEPVDRIEGLPESNQLLQRLNYFLGA